jgi:hypothetical protein
MVHARRCPMRDIGAEQHMLYAREVCNGLEHVLTIQILCRR